jgi:hypothetical protein
MKLQSKSYDGQRMRRHYDPAKTPLQRLLLSGILPDVRQQELHEVVRALDPLGLFEQVKQLQEAFLQTAVGPFSSLLSTLVPAFLPFSLEQCFPRDAQRAFLTEQEKRKTGEGEKKCDSL